MNNRSTAGGSSHGYFLFFFFCTVLSLTEEEAEVVCEVIDAVCAAGASCRESASTRVGATCTAAGTCFGSAALDAACVAGACGEPAPTLAGAAGRGAGTCFGPVLTTMSTAVPSSTVDPAAGSCSITTPAGTVSSEASFRVPSLSPALASASSTSEA